MRSVLLTGPQVIEELLHLRPAKAAKTSFDVAEKEILCRRSAIPRSLAERALGTKRAPAPRERKDFERRKVLAEQNPEGGRKPLGWRPSFRSVPCADDCRCYAVAPSRASLSERISYSGVISLHQSELAKWLEPVRAFAAFQHSSSTGFRIGALGEPAVRPGRPVPRLGELRPASCSWESRDQVPKTRRR